MKKRIIWYLLIISPLFFANIATAQVKIGKNPTNINLSSALEIEASDKGVLYPRVQLSSLTNWAPLLGSPINGMMIFNSATVADVLSPGYYYWQDGKWNRLITLDDVENISSLTGNANTDTLSHYHFIGTTDEEPLNIVTNNENRIVITQNGKVGVGNSNPDSRLDVKGCIRVGSEEGITPKPGMIRYKDGKFEAYVENANGTTNPGWVELTE